VWEGPKEKAETSSRLLRFRMGLFRLRLSTNWSARTYDLWGVGESYLKKKKPRGNLGFCASGWACSACA